MGFAYAALGAFLALMVFMFLSHTTKAVLHNTLHLTPTQFVALCTILGTSFGLWMGWDEGSKQYLAKAN